MQMNLTCKPSVHVLRVKSVTTGMLRCSKSYPEGAPSDLQTPARCSVVLGFRTAASARLIMQYT